MCPDCHPMQAATPCAQVPVQLVGRLIGKGGSGIKELREMSRANIKACRGLRLLARYTCHTHPESRVLLYASVHRVA